MGKYVKELLKELCEKSTAHGIPNIARANSKKEILFWLFFFCISSAICIYTIIGAIISYFEFEVVTKIRVLSEVESEFPTITVCNQYVFTTNYSAKVLGEILTGEYFKSTNNTNAAAENMFQFYDQNKNWFESFLLGFAFFHDHTGKKNRFFIE